MLKNGCEKNQTWGGSHQWNSGCWHWLGIRCWGWQCWRRIWRRRRTTTTTKKLAAAMAASLVRRRTTGCNTWQRITNLGTASKKEHKYSSFCLSSKRCKKKWDSTHQQRQLTHHWVLLLFFTEIHHLLVEQTNLHYQQHLEGQAGPRRRLSDIMLPDKTTFITLALQMGHELKDTLHDY